MVWSSVHESMTSATVAERDSLRCVEFTGKR